MPDISHCATVKMPLHGRDQCSALLMCSVFVDVYVICGPCVMLYILVISFVPRTMYI